MMFPQALTNLSNGRNNASSLESLSEAFRPQKSNHPLRSALKDGFNTQLQTVFGYYVAGVGAQSTPPAGRNTQFYTIFGYYMAPQATPRQLKR